MTIGLDVVRRPGFGVVMTLALVLACGSSGWGAEPTAGERAVEEAFGEQIKALTKSRDKQAVTDLANRMIERARVTPDNVEFQTALLERAYELCAREAWGYQASVDAMKAMAELVPEKRLVANRRAMESMQRQYSRTRDRERSEVGTALLAQMLVVGAEVLESGDFPEAQKVYQQAANLATSVAPDQKPRIELKVLAINSRQQAVGKVSALRARLRDGRKDAGAEQQLFAVYLLELDNPAEAVKLPQGAPKPETLALAQLATKPVEGLPTDEAITLAKGYLELAPTAPFAARPALYERALAAAERAVYLQLDPGDLRDQAVGLRTKAAAELDKLAASK